MGHLWRLSVLAKFKLRIAARRNGVGRFERDTRVLEVLVNADTSIRSIAEI